MQKTMPQKIPVARPNIDIAMVRRHLFESRQNVYILRLSNIFILYDIQSMSVLN